MEFAEWGKSRFTFVITHMKQFIPVLLFINYCIIFHTNNCKPTCAPLCMRLSVSLMFNSILSLRK